MKKQVLCILKKMVFFFFPPSKNGSLPSSISSLSPSFSHLQQPTPRPEEMCQNLTSLSQFKCSLIQYWNKFSTICVLSLPYLQCKGCHHLFASHDFGEVDGEGGLAVKPVDSNLKTLGKTFLGFSMIHPTLLCRCDQLILIPFVFSPVVPLSKNWG